MKNDIAIDLKSEKYSLDDNNKILHILFVAQDDNGTYSCSAENSVGINKLNFTVNVLTPPKLSGVFDKISKNNSDALKVQLIVRYNEPVLLKCPVNGNPEPEIIWFERHENGTENIISNETNKSDQHSNLVRIQLGIIMKLLHC